MPRAVLNGSESSMKRFFRSDDTRGVSLNPITFAPDVSIVLSIASSFAVLAAEGELADVGRRSFMPLPAHAGVDEAGALGAEPRLQFPLRFLPRLSFADVGYTRAGFEYAGVGSRRHAIRDQPS